MSPRRVLPNAAEVRAAATRIAAHIVRTPLVPSPGLTAIAGGEVFLKLECDQPGGSFKLRGALHALLALSPEARARGVVASSAGNHGIGIAMAAAQLGVPATVFVPASAPAIKREKIAAKGARVIATEPDYDAAERAARRFARAEGATFVSPCTGRALLAGAGTVGLEILEGLPTTGSIVVGVGGGGLAGGIGGFVRESAPGVRLLGAQSVRTNAMALALRAGTPVSIPDTPTLADGLAGLVDAEMLAQGQQALHAIATVQEDDIAEAIAWLHREHGVVSEGSGAVGVAALRSGALRPAAFPVVLVISGRNIDDAVWRGLVADAPSVGLRSTDGARARVQLDGAQVTSWVPAGAPEDRLFVSTRAARGRGVSVRGGIPVCWPQFGPFGPLKQHGFARNLRWTHAPAAADDAGAARFTLTDADLAAGGTAADRAAWPHAFRATLEVRVAGVTLELSLEVRNTGTDAFTFTAALHPYFAVRDADRCTVHGLAGLRYRDALRDGAAFREEAQALAIRGGLDRIYYDAPATLELREPDRGLRIESTGFPDAVVWNPGTQGTASRPDFLPGDERGMLCVESGAIGSPVTLAAGARWRASVRISAV